MPAGEAIRISRKDLKCLRFVFESFSADGWRMWYEGIAQKRDSARKAYFSLVAGERYRLSPHHPNLQYLIQSFA